MNKTTEGGKVHFQLAREGGCSSIGPTFRNHATLHQLLTIAEDVKMQGRRSTRTVLEPEEATAEARGASFAASAPVQGYNQE